MTEALSTEKLRPVPVRTDTNSTDTRKSSAELAAQWNEARLAYPIYVALSNQFGLASPPYAKGESLPARPTRSAFDRDLKWLDEIDEHVLAYQLRQIPSDILNGNEPSLRAFVQRHIKKPENTVINRDKLDWLLAQYFALCAPEDLYREEIGLEAVARVLRPIIASPTQSSACVGPLEKILVDLEHCHSVRDVMENGIFDQSRMVKDSVGSAFYEPASLVAFSRFNFLLRRAFIRILHNDLKAMVQAVDELESQGKRTVDCRRAGFTAAETTSQLRYFCTNWKQPFQKDYTESSVTRSLEQLQALRSDLEDALKHVPTQGLAPNALATSKENRAPSEPASRESTGSRFKWGRFWNRRTSEPESAPHQPDDVPIANNDLDANSCSKRISEQLSGAPAVAPRSMATISLQDTKVLLSSWEVAAFSGDTGIKSEDLRRAVVGRSLLAVAVDQRKRSGDETPLTSSLSFARSEFSYLQGRVENAKRMNNTEAAINLGISTKRLASSIEEAEKLQP